MKIWAEFMGVNNGQYTLGLKEAIATLRPKGLGEGGI